MTNGNHQLKLATLFAHHYGDLVNLAAWVSKGRLDPRDLVADTYCHLATYGGITHGESFLAHTTNCMRQRLIDRIRRQGASQRQWRVDSSAPMTCHVSIRAIQAREALRGMDPTLLPYLPTSDQCDIAKSTRTPLRTVQRRQAAIRAHFAQYV